jgi:hypothetical protein
MARARECGSDMRGIRGRGGTATTSVCLLARGSVVLLVALSFVLPGVVDAGAAPPKWVMRAVPAVNDFPLKSLSCTGTSCLALSSECSVGGCGGLLPAKAFLSANLGASWKDAAVPSSVGDATTVSCGAPTLCVATAYRGPLSPAVASAIIVTRNGGASWAVHVESQYTLAEAACASSKSCVALGSPRAGSTMTSLDLVSTNSGQSWSKGSFPAIKGYIAAVTCGTATDCVSVGTSATSAGIALVSANVGKSWKSMPVPAGTTGLRTVSCDGLVCSALSSSQVLTSANGGKSWTVHLLPSSFTVQASACLTATHCVIVGDQNATSHTVPVVELTPNGGASWSNQVLPKLDGSLEDVSCVPTSCAAAGVRVVFSGATPKAEFPLVFTY